LNRAFVSIGVIFAGFLAYLLWWPIPISPVAWSLPPNPGLTGAFEKNDVLAELQVIALDGDGPEDLTMGTDGFLYTGVEDGRIIRFHPDDAANASTFVNTGGRPLGLQFDAHGNLIVADIHRGLLLVAPDRTLTVLTDSVDGSHLGLVNGLDIAGDGTIWFSDATQRSKGNAMLDYLEGIASGRLLSYNPETKITKVHLTELRFANGVALGPDDAFVLVNETLGARVTRLWLAGPRMGQQDRFIDALPGHPDNISYNDAGMFWLAMPMARVPAFEALTDNPRLRAALMRLPQMWSADVEPVAWVIGVDAGGNMRHNLQDWGGNFPAVTSVNEFDGVLYLGSIEASGIGYLPVPGN